MKEFNNDKFEDHYKTLTKQMAEEFEAMKA